MINLPKNNGWYVELITKDGRHYEDILSIRECRTREEAESHIENTLNIKKSDCKKWDFCECMY